MTRVPGTGDPPRISRSLLRLFSLYSRFYVRRHIHALRVTRDTAPAPVPPGPCVVYLNHASWWDPLVCLCLAGAFFPGRPGYAPIDAAALRRYRFFSKLGFFGIEAGALRGARTFLRTASAILEQRDAVLWITPQGRFADVREHPLRFQGGLGDLAARWARRGEQPVTFLPLAIEYAFWHERLPEVLVRFGTPVHVAPGSDPEAAPATWTRMLEARLEHAMDDLGRDSALRDPARFQPLLSGTSGVGGTYDLWRRTRALLTGGRPDMRHGHL